MTPLEADIRAQIAHDGPMPVARYMALCLGHPVHGYYMTRDPLGAAGDFTTAPEISQMFGELIGLWSAAVWQEMGQPARVNLVEFGPGRGALMADALRAASRVPAFRAALAVHLVETSPALRAKQQRALEGCGVSVTWHSDLEAVPDGPLLAIANEFFDALPVHQFIKGPRGWHERMVGLDDDDRLVCAASPDPSPVAAGLIPGALKNAPLGSIYEWRPDDIVRALARRITTHGGAALIVDYGHVESATGDTLQALRSHSFADPLDAPGEADLTTHVDFAALARSAARTGAAAHGPLSQGAFLRRLGIEVRAAKLKAHASPDQAHDIDTALERLTGGGSGMGELFKVLALANPTLGPLPGFDT